MRRREFLLYSTMTVLAPAGAAAKSVSRPMLRDDPETRNMRNWIGLGFGAIPVAYLVWFTVGKVRRRWNGGRL